MSYLTPLFLNRYHVLIHNFYCFKCIIRSDNEKHQHILNIADTLRIKIYSNKDEVDSCTRTVLDILRFAVNHVSHEVIAKYELEYQTAQESYLSRMEAHNGW